MRERSQRLVAGGMAIPVVEFLEVIDVEHQHCHVFAFFAIG